MHKAIVIGFVGGFVKSDDTRHPEVDFAALLRDRNPAAVHAEVFSNHDGKKARRRILQLLDTDADGALTASEKEQASIIIYGHSWCGSQAVTLARELGKLGVPVLLTIQLDSVRKPGQDDSTISKMWKTQSTSTNQKASSTVARPFAQLIRHEPTFWEISA